MAEHMGVGMEVNAKGYNMQQLLILDETRREKLKKTESLRKSKNPKNPGV